MLLERLPSARQHAAERNHDSADGAEREAQLFIADAHVLGHCEEVHVQDQ
jgi:hypothetical protein